MPRGPWQVEEGGGAVPPELQAGSAPRAGGIPGASCQQQASPGAGQAPSHPLWSCPCVCPLTVPHWPLKMKAEPLPHLRLQVTSVPRRLCPLGWEEGSWWGKTRGRLGPVFPPRTCGPRRIRVEGRRQDACGLSRAARCPLASGRPMGQLAPAGKGEEKRWQLSPVVQGQSEEAGQGASWGQVSALSLTDCD